MFKSLSFVFFFLSGIITSAQIPDGYYEDAEGKSGDELKTALHNIIDNHKEYSYNALRDYILKNTDEDPNNSNDVILLYSGISRSKSEFGGNSGEWNREHVWAKSHGDFGNDPPAGTDAHHIRPTDVQVNSIRGNLDFDMGGNPVSGAPGCKVDGDSFEPRDEVKGDVARMIFYMATRYEGGSGEPDLEVVDRVNTYPLPEHGKLSVLLQWNEFDPPDAFEENRNNVIYYEYQENRNPFIDHPEYAERIWGDPTSVTEDPENVISVYPNPVSQTAIVDYNFKANYNFTLIGIDGKKYLSGKTVNGKTVIDFSGNSAGIYFLILTNNAGQQVDEFKLLKTIH